MSVHVLKKTLWLIFCAAILLSYQNCGGGFRPLQGTGLSQSSSLSTGGSGSTTGSGSSTTASGGPQYGLNVDFNEQAFANLVQATSSLSGSGALTSDTNGWPQQDFELSIDNRYTFAWVSGALNIDPLKFSTDLSGTYDLSFTGQAQLSSSTGNVTFANQSYNSGTNTTTVQATVAPVSTGVFFIINFAQTKRLPGDTAGDGLTNVQLIRNGSTASQTFTNLWLNSINNYSWSALRFMGAMGTNSYGTAGTSEAYPYLLQWATDRPMPGNGPLYGTIHPGIHGPPWEDVVIAAIQTGKDIWINVPVNASATYVTQMAQLFHAGNAATGNQGIPEGTNIYLEYSNEMWHLGFPQGPWNQQAAEAEVAAGNSNLNYDGMTDENMWRLRRIAKRTIEIGEQFKSVFSDRPDRIRPVINNAWLGFYPDMMNYVTANYGAPANYIYGIAQTAYYTSADASSVSAILQGEMANSDTNKNGFLQGRAIATFYGVHSLVYEGGEGETGTIQAATPADPTLANKFAASRDSGMSAVLTHDVLDNWFPSGGELYMQFSQAGRYSVYGFWGITEDLTNLATAKWTGATSVMAATVPPAQPGTVLPANVGSSISIPETALFELNWYDPTDQPWLEMLVYAPAAGVYSVQLEGQQTASGSIQIWADNTQAGTTTLPSASSGNSSAINVTLTAGPHSIFVYGPAGAGPQGVTAAASANAVIQRVQ